MHKDFSPDLGYQEKWLAVQKDSSAQFGYRKKWLAVHRLQHSPMVTPKSGKQY